MGILDSLVGQPPLESSPLDMEDKCQCRKPIQFLTPILADIVLKKGQKRTGNASTYKLRASLHTRHDGNIAKSQQAASRNEKRKSQPFSGPITNFATYIDILVIFWPRVAKLQYLLDTFDSYEIWSGVESIQHDM